MAEEYNYQYMTLIKRLSILKARLPYETLTDSKKEELLRMIDNLLKILDDRYSEERYLDDIEMNVDDLERTL